MNYILMTPYYFLLNASLCKLSFNTLFKNIDPLVLEEKNIFEMHFFPGQSQIWASFRFSILANF
jgi:hypothetical protein